MKTPDPLPVAIPRQTPASARWQARYRELVEQRGGAARLTREDRAELSALLAKDKGGGK